MSRWAAIARFCARTGGDPLQPIPPSLGYRSLTPMAGRVSEMISSLDLGFQPEAAVSGAILLQSEYSTTLICNAVSRVGRTYEPAGLGIVEFKLCLVTKFGYPNDEAWCAIPRTKGLSYGFYEVMQSAWPEEIAALNRYRFPNWAPFPTRHFLALFHDSSFECLCREWKARLATNPPAAVLGDIAAKIGRE